MRILTAAALTLALAACSGPTGLPAGLVARMDQPGAQIDRAEALGIVNQLRVSRGVAPLAADETLNAAAQDLAANYAASNTPPKSSGPARAMRVSAGYPSFAETFSGWRSRGEDVAALVDPASTSMGLGVAYSDSSTYGTHWVILFD